MTVKIYLKSYLIKFVEKEEAGYMIDGAIKLQKSRIIHQFITSQFKNKRKFEEQEKGTAFIRVIPPTYQYGQKKYFIGREEVRYINSMLRTYFHQRMELYIALHPHTERKQNIKNFLQLYGIDPYLDTDVDTFIKSNQRYRSKDNDFFLTQILSKKTS